MLSLAEIGPVVLEKKIFYISLFSFYLPLEMDMTHHLNKLKFSSPNNALRQVWLILASWSFKFRQSIFAISLLTLLRRGRGPSFEQI